ncbi:MAG: hypothetical protein U9Q37_01935 [Euryarchaeota archaeon]|nr:hypothetical protein [Euryarchaeota archaeon]
MFPFTFHKKNFVCVSIQTNRIDLKVDAARTGILASVAVSVAERGIGIMQAIADDPRLAKRPTPTIITDRQISDDRVGELLKCDGMQGVRVC